MDRDLGLGEQMLLARSWLLRWLTVSVLGLAAFAMLAPTGLAHPGGTASDGCHYCRTNCDSWGVPWNERHCHGGSSSGTSSGSTNSGSSAPPPPPPPPAPADIEPPASPAVEGTVVDGSDVTVQVSAEEGSTVRIAVAGAVVATARATGVTQAVTFALGDGTHRLEVTARDAAGNVSSSAATTVSVDGTPPEPAVLGIQSEAEASSPWTVVSIEGEAGATWQLSGVGRSDTQGEIPGDGRTDVVLLLANGTHETAVVLTDDAGNVSRPAGLAVDVSIPAPDAPELALSTEPGSGEPTVEVSGPPAGTATVEVRRDGGGRVTAEDVELDDDGEATASFEVEDGEYELVTTASDFQGQASPESRIDLTVDTVGPEIDLEVDEALLSQGRIAWSVLTEAGAAVRVAARDLGSEEVFDSDGELRAGEVETDRSGTVQLEVVATDAFGNDTTRTVELAVSQPTGPVDLALGFGLLLGLGYAGYRGLRWATGEVRAARAGR